MRRSRVSQRGVVALLALAQAMLASPGTAAEAIDWSSVPGREVVLFYPGQSSWEWSLIEKDHSGAPKLRKGKSCGSCHEDEEADIALDPGQGRRSTVTADVRVAHDGERLYVRVEWPAAPAASGRPAGSSPEARVTVMFDDGGVKESKLAGCWAACHDDLTGMASAGAGKERTKYVTASRKRLRRSGGGDDLKPQAELDALLAKGSFFEYWQASLDRGQPAVAVDGYVFERRHESQAPLVGASAELADGRWRVELSRALTPGSKTHKDLVRGKTYTVGFAIYDGNGEGRSHLVSLEYSLVLDKGKADFVAVGRKG